MLGHVAQRRALSTPGHEDRQGGLLHRRGIEHRALRLDVLPGEADRLTTQQWSDDS